MFCILLFLVSGSLLTAVSTLLLINLVWVIEDYLTGGTFLRDIFKEIKREPTVIHDVYIEHDGTEDFKWNQKTTKESNCSSRNWSSGTKSIGTDSHQ